MVPLNDVKANSKLLINIFQYPFNFYFSLSLNIRCLCLVFPCIHFLFSYLCMDGFFFCGKHERAGISEYVIVMLVVPHTTPIDGDLFEWMFSDS